jgi:PIN domain nuclease of toxin-antitoxin system
VKAYVLDTHALVWYLRGRNVGTAAGRALREIDRGRSRAWIPAIVVVELALLRERGRSAIGVAEVEASMTRNPELQPLSLDFAQAKEFALLRGVTDPFDRLIMAAARSLGCPLVTADERIAASGMVQVIWD